MAEGTGLGTQKELIHQARGKLLPGDEWCVMSNKWWKKWEQYISLDISGSMLDCMKWIIGPGPVSNNDIVTEDGDLKEGLRQDVDFKVISKSQWKLMVHWYGVKEGEQPLLRKVINMAYCDNDFGEHRTEVEVYALKVKLCRYRNLNDRKNKYFSKADTVEFIEEEAKRSFGIPEHTETRLWQISYSPLKYQLLPKGLRAYYVGIHLGDTVAVEVKSPEGTWPSEEEVEVENSTESDDLKDTLEISRLEHVRCTIAKKINDQLERKEDKRGETLEILMTKLECVQAKLDCLVGGNEAQKKGSSEEDRHHLSGLSRKKIHDFVNTHMQCTICNELFIHAMTLSCSHTFCRHCIMLWRRKKDECPICRSRVTVAYPSRVIDGFIEDIVKNLSGDEQDRRMCIVMEREED